MTPSNFKLSDAARELPGIVATAHKIAAENRKKNRVLRSLVEALIRLKNAAAHLPVDPRSAVHYFHDPRLARFTPQGVNKFATCRGDGPSRMSWRFGAVVARYWLQALICQVPRNCFRNVGSLILASLDLAILWALIQNFGVSKFYTSAHFQPYVLIIHALRRKQIVQQHHGVQHGAWTLASLKALNNEPYYDSYTVLHSRFEATFKRYFSAQVPTLVQVASPTSCRRWATAGQPHIALAMQSDNYPADLLLAEVAARLAQRHGLALFIYTHPANQPPARVLRRIQQLATIFPTERFGDSRCVLTRYSTLAMELAINGVPAFFVDVGERIDFATEGLDVTVVTMQQLEEVLDAKLASLPPVTDQTINAVDAVNSTFAPTRAAGQRK